MAILAAYPLLPVHVGSQLVDLHKQMQRVAFPDIGSAMTHDALVLFERFLRAQRDTCPRDEHEHYGPRHGPRAAASCRHFPIE